MIKKITKGIGIFGVAIQSLFGQTPHPQEHEPARSHEIQYTEEEWNTVIEEVKKAIEQMLKLSIDENHDRDILGSILDNGLRETQEAYTHLLSYNIGKPASQRLNFSNNSEIIYLSTKHSFETVLEAYREMHKITKDENHNRNILRSILDHGIKRTEEAYTHLLSYNIGKPASQRINFSNNSEMIYFIAKDSFETMLIAYKELKKIIEKADLNENHERAVLRGILNQLRKTRI